MQLWLRACLFLGSLSFFSLCSAQDQSLADSLILHYHSGSFPLDDELVLLKSIAANETNPDRKLEFSELLISKATPPSHWNYLHIGHLQKGNALRVKGELGQALESYYKSIDFAQKANDQIGVGKLTISIADTYSEIGNSSNAQRYYDEGIKLLRNTNDSVSLATALLNAGDEYFNSKKYDSAILFFQESGSIFNKINYQIGTAYNLGNLGMVYAEQGKDDLAARDINQAIEILESLQDYYPIAVYLTYMSDIYLRQQDISTALSYANRSLTLATRYRLKDQISEAFLKLAELHEKNGDVEQSYRYYKSHIAYRDSVKNLESIQVMADLRTDYEVTQKQIEVDLQKKNKQIIAWASGIALFLVGLMVLGLFRRYQFIKATNKIIEEEKDRSDKLLLNILPEETATELKEHGKVKAKKFESVTVLFTDFEGFTALAERVEPERLVESIDVYFKAFDEIITRYGLEKIKTIGDSYMCAGGLPVYSRTHARDVILAAKEMLRFVEDLHGKEERHLHLSMRVGVHTGPVIAGIVGTKKWQYDIWGDTVNIASRMESMSALGRVNISESTHEIIKDEFSCEFRGEIEVKNRGFLKMYFLT